MQKTILITGATDGIGLETAKMLLAKGHKVLIHGRNPEKLSAVEKALVKIAGGGQVESYLADLSRLTDAASMAKIVAEKHDSLDALINNAGVLKTGNAVTEDGLDVRFAVNVIAPYLLTKMLMPLMGEGGRVVNLSSAAQAPVSPTAIAGHTPMADMEAYAQSKTAIAMWSRHPALEKPAGPIIIAVNPGSLLGTNMVRDGFGIEGKSIGIGADILCRAALADEFAAASGQFYDNDSHRFAVPHPDVQDSRKLQELVDVMDAVLKRCLPQD